MATLNLRNPTGYDGSPATQYKQGIVRFATVEETDAGTATNLAISPATAQAATVLDFASPPVLGFGSTTPRPVAATTLTSSGNTTLATGAAVTTISIANVAPSGARIGTYHGGNSTQDDTVNWLNGAPSAGTQTFNLFSGNATGGTQRFNLFTGTRAGTARIGTGAAAHNIRIAGATALVGFFDASPVVAQAQGAITNNVTAGGSTGVIADFADLTVFANSAAAIRNDIYQLALALSGVITALRNYGLLV